MVGQIEVIIGASSSFTMRVRAAELYAVWGVVAEARIEDEPKLLASHVVLADEDMILVFIPR